MSTREGLEPSRSQDSDTHTQPLARDPAASDADASDSPRPEPAEAVSDASTTPPSPDPTGSAWPPSWGRSPASWGQTQADGPSWTQPSAQPPAAQGPSWTQPAAAQGPSWTQPTGTGAGPDLTQPSPPAADASQAQPPGADPDPARTRTGPAGDPTQPGWGQGGGYPTVPTWGTKPAEAGSPPSRRPSRWLAALMAAAVLFTGGYWVNEALDNDAAPAGAGIPTAAPIAAAPVQSGEEPAAAVANALLPTVVEIRHANGLGSGFVYDSNGYIMTAAHVVAGVEEVDVRLYDGTKVTGKVVGTDELNDVGVVKVDRTGLKAAPLAVGRALQVGQFAVAIGSPFGLAETVTAGIVSSSDRVIEGREVIQTDAPINPGNSGGVLADRQGRVIGINSAIQSNQGSGGNVGIGFAVPIDLAAKSATAIVQGKPIQTGYLGVSMADAPNGQDGALVQDVTSGSPAAKAGLQVGDLVASINGQAVQNYSELAARIRATKPGEKVDLGVIRSGNETTISATLTQRPAG